MKFTDCVNLLILVSVPTMATFWPAPSLKSNRRGFTSKSLSTFTWPENSLERDGSSNVKALVFLSHGYAEHLSPYYDSLGETCAARGVFCWGHDHVGHGTSPGARTEVKFFDDLSVKLDTRPRWVGSVQTEGEGASRYQLYSPNMSFVGQLIDNRSHNYKYIPNIYSAYRTNSHCNKKNVLTPAVVPFFLMGQSIGGLIALQNPTLFDGLLLTAPLLHRWGLFSYFSNLTRNEASYDAV